MGRAPEHLRQGQREGQPLAERVPDPSVPPEGGSTRRVRPWAPRPVRTGPGVRRLGRRRLRLTVVLVSVAVLVAVAGGAWGWHAWQARLAAQRRGTGVALALEVPGYGEGSSPIPLKVTGTTDGGDQVAGVRIITQTQGWLSLYPGSYEVVAAGSPVTASGGTFQVPEGAWRVVVGERAGEVTAPDGSVGEELALAYAPVSPADVTDEEVDAIRAWMVGLGVQGVDGYVSAVEATRGAEGRG